MKSILIGAIALSLVGGAALAAPGDNMGDRGRDMAGDHHSSNQGPGDHMRGGDHMGGDRMGGRMHGPRAHGRHHRWRNVCHIRHHHRVCHRVRW